MAMTWACSRRASPAVVERWRFSIGGQGASI
jgi:hypothetical protein